MKLFFDHNEEVDDDYLEQYLAKIADDVLVHPEDDDTEVDIEVDYDDGDYDYDVGEDHYEVTIYAGIDGEASHHYVIEHLDEFRERLSKDQKLSDYTFSFSVEPYS